MRSLIRRIYWKFVAVIARIARAVTALNEGYTPAGSVSTGPHQPLSALRDAVSLLGATAGRLDARLERISLAPVSAVDRLAHAIALNELSRAPLGTPIVLIGDATALRVACDLADLNYPVSVWDTIDTAHLPLPDSIERHDVDAAPALTEGVLAVASSSPLTWLPKAGLDAIGAALKTGRKALLVSCAPTEIADASAASSPWRSESKTLTIEVRPIDSTQFTVTSRPLRSIVLASQLG